MKKKLILPWSFIYCFELIVLLGMTAAGVVCVCLMIPESELTLTERILGIIFGAIFIIVFGGYSLGFVFKSRIELQTDRIYVPKGMGAKGVSLIQHKKEILYSEISQIGFAYVDTDSEGWSVKRLFRRLFYLLFIDNNEEAKAVCMDYYTKRQTAKMIDEIVLRCKAVGRDIPITSGKEFLAECIAKIKAKDKEAFKEIKQKFSSKKKTADERDKEDLNNREDGEEDNS